MIFSKFFFDQNFGIVSPLRISYDPYDVTNIGVFSYLANFRIFSSTTGNY